MDDDTDPSINSGQVDPTDNSQLAQEPAPVSEPEPTQETEPTANDQISISNDQSNPNDQNLNTENPQPIEQAAPSGSEGQVEQVSPSETVPSEALQQSSGQANQSFIKNLLFRAQEKIQFNKNKKLDKIMALAREKGKINNADVCKVLRVSRKTATNYLQELEKQNRLRQVGQVGHDVYYLPNA